MTPDQATGKSRVYVTPDDARRWRDATGRIQVFVPLSHGLAVDCWAWLTREHTVLDALHDDMEEVRVGSRLTVFSQTFVVLEITHHHPFPDVSTAWAEPWTHWRHLKD